MIQLLLLLRVFQVPSPCSLGLWTTCCWRKDGSQRWVREKCGVLASPHAGGLHRRRASCVLGVLSAVALMDKVRLQEGKCEADAQFVYNLLNLFASATIQQIVHNLCVRFTFSARGLMVSSNLHVSGNFCSSEKRSWADSMMH